MKLDRIKSVPVNENLRKINYKEDSNEDTANKQNISNTVQAGIIKPGFTPMFENDQDTHEKEEKGSAIKMKLYEIKQIFNPNQETNKQTSSKGEIDQVGIGHLKVNVSKGETKMNSRNEYATLQETEEPTARERVQQTGANESEISVAESLTS